MGLAQLNCKIDNPWPG